ncbi:acyltransferase family protein [Hymenobacter rubripertinctus]|uniref:Acyltransferase 3 domain-containing protein n=1 Tax=Hymenobacter rubripertinctus TaxID=2029981 RepID=A0A418QJ82_9BACT|nr:acyltransferase family protein [Hymenobacter rubripertinctus]RIY05202.1 hypothetical protein D0T11_20805 [Hymenobacter rubripertinctus]
MPRNYTVDVFRILGALCVVALHAPLDSLPNEAALLIRLGSRWAVPFFFLASGFFFGAGKQERPTVSAAKQLSFLLSIFLIANIIYGLFFLVDQDPKTLFSPSLVGLLVGQSGHLWYISASIFGYLLLQYAVNRYSDRVLLLTGSAVLIGILAGVAYSTLVHATLPYEVGHLFTSIPFLWGGYLLARHRVITSYFTVTRSVLLIGLGFGLELVEAIGLYKLTGASPHNQELLLGTTLMAFGILCLALTWQTPTENRFAAWGRRYSLQIYLYHALVLAVLYHIFHLESVSPYLGWISPIIGFFVTLGLLKALEQLSPRAFKVLSGS